VQPRPTAAELLAAVAEVLEQEVVPATTGPVQHRARVAASLVGIVERELRLAAAADRREAKVVAELVPGTSGDLLGDRTLLAQALRGGLADDEADHARIWPALVELVRADLAVVKPGHDGWTGD